MSRIGGGVGGGTIGIGDKDGPGTKSLGAAGADMVQYVHKGEAIDYTPAEGIAAGSVVIIGRFVGVAQHAIAAGALGSVQIEGVFRMPKKAAQEIAAGAAVYWAADPGEISSAIADGTLCGITVAAAAADDTHVLVRLGM